MTAPGAANTARRALGIVLGLVALAGWWITLAPPVVGGPASYVVIRGDSMLPTYQTGDLVIVHASGAYRVGDVVAYHVPEGELGAGLLVIHRIVGGDGTTGYVMQGDNNPAPDPWQPRSSDIAGSAWVTVPSLGRVIAFLHQPAAAGALAAALVVGWLVRREHRPEPTGRTPAASGTGRPSRVRRQRRQTMRLDA